MLLRALAYFIYQILLPLDSDLYSLQHIEEILKKHPEPTGKLVSLFDSKFNPESNKSQSLTVNESLDQPAHNIFQQGYNFVTYLLKTNFYVKDKTSLGFRLDPQFLEHLPFDRRALFPELPWGIFYIQGRNFFGFHIRFRDLARGGLRTIIGANRENVFLECYNLAYTQQKKNKDIPEGGAKGVIFLEGAEIYKAQRSFIKTLLSLVNCHPDGTLRDSAIIDYYGQCEYLYLGPDENMHDSMIEWIANESEKEHYFPGVAFMSGKSQMGINHKEYGVTSLGLNVYLKELLHYLGIDPLTDCFTVKMTGGPDGDVAGNQILNFYRDFPKTAKLIALTDISGTIFDPQGLDLAILVNFFKESKAISHYPVNRLNERGFLLDRVKKALMRKTATGVTEEILSQEEANALYRKNVHQVKADIFIPCGGRPRTLSEDNWEELLDSDKEPTARAIVEGANLYLTEEARTFYEAHGVLVIKDSSANKGGVIASSYEILADLICSREEFVQIKPRFVEEVLQKIILCAQKEAKLLLATHTTTKKGLTAISEAISQKIIALKDLLLNYLESIDLLQLSNHKLLAIYLDSIPQVLREKYEKRLIEVIPDRHKKAIIAAHLASEFVYQRGVDASPSIVDIITATEND